MKNQANSIQRMHHFRNSVLGSCFAGLLIIALSCTQTTVPYRILEIAGEGDIFSNYSKSFLLTAYEPDSINPAAIPGSPGDLFIADDYTFVLNKKSSAEFSVKKLKEGLYLNDKLVFLAIPENDDLLPWFGNLEDKDLSALQFIGTGSEMPESYLPHLSRLAEIKPGIGLLIEGSLTDNKRILEIFNPPYIVGVDLQLNDFNLLSGLKNLELLAGSFIYPVLTQPFPRLPKLKQLVLTDLDKNPPLPADFLINNTQLERVILQKPVKFDMSLLNPLKNLKELVIRESQQILNADLINTHKKLEVLVIGDDNADYDLNNIELPRLRWMTFFNNTTQNEFDSFIKLHPSLEIIELVKYDTISSLQALSGLTKLTGLTITDTVTDIGSVAKLTNLKYLSLPSGFIEDSVNSDRIKKSLPDTRIVANEGFCLGSGWLLLVIPLVFIIRFFCRNSRQEEKG